MGIIQLNSGNVFFPFYQEPTTNTSTVQFIVQKATDNSWYNFSASDFTTAAYSGNDAYADMYEGYDGLWQHSTGWTVSATTGYYSIQYRIVESDAGTFFAKGDMILVGAGACQWTDSGSAVLSLVLSVVSATNAILSAQLTAIRSDISAARTDLSAAISAVIGKFTAATCNVETWISSIRTAISADISAIHDALNNLSSDLTTIHTAISSILSATTVTIPGDLSSVRTAVSAGQSAIMAQCSAICASLATARSDITAGQDTLHTDLSAALTQTRRTRK